MQQIISLLTKIPDVVWSGLLASMLTLTGVMLSNWSNSKRLLIQLSNDSNEKEKERIHSLRKEVYLKAAGEIAKVNSYLGKLPQLDPAKENIADPLSEFFSVAAKLQLVAEPETTSLASQLVTRYGEILMLLLAKVAPIHNLNTDIRIASDFYDQHQAQVARILAEMTQLNESGQPDTNRFNALRHSLESAQELANKYANERTEAYGAHAKALREYSITLLNEIRTVGTLQIKLSSAIRKELNLTTDLAAWETLLFENQERMDRSMKTLLDNLEERSIKSQHPD